MKRIKRLFGDLVAAAISLLILAAAVALPFETVQAAPTAAGPLEWTGPSGGAGRIASCMNEEKTHDNVAIDPDGSMREEVKEAGEESPHPSAAPTPSPQGEGLDQGEGVTITEEEYVEAEAAAEAEYVEVIPEREDPPETDLDALIREAAERYGLPWELVSAVCWAESTYNPYAVSSTPDYGLMQVTQSVMGSYGLTAENWMDPAANLDAGCRILREKLDLSGGDAANALTRYRFGDAEALAMWSRGEWSNWYSERVIGKYYEIIREG